MTNYKQKEIKMTAISVNTASSSVATNALDKAVSEFNQYAKQTVTGILEMGRIVSETQSAYDKKSAQFKEFCRRIGYEPESSSIRKLKLIGDKYINLKKCADSLPNNWTSLYEISQLASDELNSLIDQGVIHQEVRGVEIKALLKKAKSGNEVTEDVDKSKTDEDPNGTQYQFTCSLAQIDDAVTNTQLRLLIESLKRLKVKVKMSQQLESALEPFFAKAA